jgi:hypothetical protein
MRTKTKTKTVYFRKTIIPQKKIFLLDKMGLKV